jgi:hypothetical protein
MKPGWDTALASAGWVKRADAYNGSPSLYPRFDRPDGAAVRYDYQAACHTSNCSLPNHLGWIAFGPGKDNHNYLAKRRRALDRGVLGTQRSKARVPRKFKTATAAMAAVDKEFPFEVK